MTDLFANALLSAEPHPDIPAEHRIFEPFIGSWELVVTWYDAQGGVHRQEQGEWHFARVLEGRAIQDVWIVPPRSERTGHADPYEYGTSLRFFDHAEGAWRSTWLGPQQGALHSFLARKQGEAVVLETVLGDGRRMRWSFSDIRPDSFIWRNEREDAGRWTLTQDFAARRIRPA
jgi:hypothetical protein